MLISLRSPLAVSYVSVFKSLSHGLITSNDCPKINAFSLCFQRQHSAYLVLSRGLFSGRLSTALRFSCCRFLHLDPGRNGRVSSFCFQNKSLPSKLGIWTNCGTLRLCHLCSVHAFFCRVVNCVRPVSSGSKDLFFVCSMFPRSCFQYERVENNQRLLCYLHTVHYMAKSTAVLWLYSLVSILMSFSFTGPDCV